MKDTDYRVLGGRPLSGSSLYLSVAPPQDRRGGYGGVVPVEPYRRRRLAALAGEGPLEVYRACQNAIGLIQVPPVQRPQALVRGMPAFTALWNAHHRGGDLVGAAEHLHSNGCANVAKALAEVIFELVRQEVAAASPSRLDCVWAFLDPLDAFSFTERTATGYLVFRALVAPRVMWCIADMNSFSVRDTDDMRTTALQATSEAPHYWLMDRPDALPEVLVAGEVHLQGSAQFLVPWLVERGLVAE